MMKRRGFAAGLAAAVAWLGATTFAHPLNVYVQVADIDVTHALVTLQLRLTPGVNVADEVLKEIDVNHDGVISVSEEASYAERVRRDVSLAIDGRPAALEVRSTSTAPVAQLRQGLGDIVLVFDAPLAGSEGVHRVTFENRHETSIAAYLVNGLEPRDTTIRIAGQQRNYDQSRYQLDFEVVAAAAGTPAQARMRVDGAAAVESFFWPGVRHILTGYDHLLFLAALVLGAASLWDLAKVVTAFTVAHSLTLTLAALDLVYIPDRLVEPAIAVSIVFVAAQNVLWPARARDSSRIAAAFVFGLFHGLGFAGGLLDVMHQMQTGTVLFAILGFSLGVEAGNQLVLVPLFGTLRFVRRGTPVTDERQLFTRFERLGSAAISAAGVYYLGIAVAGLA